MHIFEIFKELETVYGQTGAACSFELLDESFPWQELTNVWKAVLLEDVASTSSCYYDVAAYKW